MSIVAVSDVNRYTSRPMPEVEGVRHQMINVGDVDLHLAEAGEGPPLLLLHGYPQHWYLWRELIPDLEALLTAAAPDDPVARELAAFWRARRDVIHALVERADALGRQLARSRFPLVLCHADLHTWNVLVDAERILWIVDWDEAILAPKERDLMFVVGGLGHDLVRPHDTECFFEGYGEATIDRRLLAYYRAAWAVQDIAAYGEQALLVPTLGEETRRAEMHGFMDLFDPGSIIDVAGASETS